MEPEKKSNGALVGLIIIVIILIVGGIYVWQMKSKNSVPATTKEVTIEDSASLDTLQNNLNGADLDVGASVISSVK